jgi:hypothetical protein
MAESECCPKVCGPALPKTENVPKAEESAWAATQATTYQQEEVDAYNRALRQRRDLGQNLEQSLR